MGMRRRDRGSDYISTNNDGIPGRFGDKKKILSLLAWKRDSEKLDLAKRSRIKKEK